MSPLDLFLYIIAGATGLAVAGILLGACVVLGGAILRRMTRGPDGP